MVWRCHNRSCDWESDSCAAACDHDLKRYHAAVWYDDAD